MRTSTLHLLLFLLLTLLVSGSGPAAVAVAPPPGVCAQGPQLSGWELQKQEDGITVYTREAAGSNVHEFKATVTVAAPVQRFLQIADDIAAYPRWLADCRSARAVPGPDRCAYLKLDMPWPAKDRDLVLQLEQEKRPDGSTRINLTGQPERVPPSGHYIRIPEARGFFQFMPQPDGRTEVTYQLFADPGGSLPGRLVNTVLVKAPLQTLRNLRKLAQES